MRSDKNPKDFFEKMKKKPALQAILDNIDNYTIDELNSIEGQPKWIRKQLIRIKMEKDAPIDETSDIKINQIADMMEKKSTQDDERKKKYPIRKWIGSNWNMPAGRTGSFQVEINPGDLFLVYGQGHVKIQSSISNMNMQQWNYFQQNSEYMGDMDVTEFAKFVSKNLSSQYPNTTTIDLQNNQPKNSDDRGLFRIIRHD